MGWTPGVVRRDIKTLRLYNQVIKMNENRLTRLVFEEERAVDGQWY